MEEVKLGRMMGPLRSKPFTYTNCNPIGLVPKKDDEGHFLSVIDPVDPDSWRLITHLSSPKGSSINDHIPEEFSSIKYTSFDQAIQLVQSTGKGAFMAKTDIKSAFRQLPIHPFSECHSAISTLSTYAFRLAWRPRAGYSKSLQHSFSGLWKVSSITHLCFITWMTSFQSNKISPCATIKSSLSWMSLRRLVWK